jgi:hypothetical protein
MEKERLALQAAEQPVRLQMAMEEQGPVAALWVRLQPALLRRPPVFRAPEQLQRSSRRKAERLTNRRQIRVRSTTEQSGAP